MNRLTDTRRACGVTTYRTQVWLGPATARSSRASALVRRFPLLGTGADPYEGWLRAPVDEHVVAAPGERDPRFLAIADVLVRPVRGHRLSQALSEVRQSYPGWLVTVLIGDDGQCLMSGAGGWRAWLARAGDASSIDDVLCGASVMHAWLVDGRPLDGLTRGAFVVDDVEAAVVRRRRLRVVPIGQAERPASRTVAG